MRHHRLDRAVFVVGGGVGIGQQVLRIEDVEALVLHRTHVEVVGGDDVEYVEVVLAAVGILVPAHGTLQRVHGVAAASNGIGLGPDHQLHRAAAVGDVVVLDLLQATGDQREQIAGLGMRIDEAGPVTAIVQLALAVRIAAGQQHREALAIGVEGDGVAGQYVGAIGEEGDVAETLCLALGQQEAALALAGQVQAFQRRVGRRLHPHTRFQHAAVAHVVHFQHVIRVAPGAFGYGLAVQRDGQQLQAFTVEPQRFLLRSVPSQVQASGDLGGVDPQIKRELDLIHAPGGGAIVTEPDQGRGGIATSSHRTAVG